MAVSDNARFIHEQQDKSQQAKPDTSPPSTAPAESQTFEAATAVLDTNELLHLMISAVPREYRTALRRVSKNWQAAVLKIGHVMEPFDHDYYPTEADLNLSLGPIYALERDLQVKHNPVFFLVGRRTNEREDSEDHTYHMTVEHHFSFADLAQRKHEFITIPPLSQVLMDAQVHQGEQLASLRVRTGICIGDLLEHFNKMNGLDNNMSYTTFKGASFANRHVYDWDDCESLDMTDLIDGGSGPSGGDGGGETEDVDGGKDGRDGGGSGDGEVEVEKVGTDD